MPLSAKKRSFRSLGAAVFELLAISSKNLKLKFCLTSGPFFGHFRSENRKNKQAKAYLKFFILAFECDRSREKIPTTAEMAAICVNKDFSFRKIDVFRISALRRGASAIRLT